MSIVFCVLANEWEDRTLLAVCATRERAEAYIMAEFPTYRRIDMPNGEAMWRSTSESRYGGSVDVYIDDQEVLT